MWEAAQRGWDAPPGAPIPFITAGFDVRFLRPTPLAETVQLVGSTVSVDDKEIVVRSELISGEKVRAEMTASWKRFRPR
jgi:hypothetical protein